MTQRGSGRRNTVEKYTQWSDIPWATVGAYIFLVILMVILFETKNIPENVGLFLVAVLVVYLARMVSLHYTLEDGKLKVLRLFGSRRVPISEVHKVEPSSLRDLSPVSFMGGWGWRSRMWSPVVGRFDNLSTVHKGLMIYATEPPFFISPKDPDKFLAQLQKETGSRLLPE